MSTLFQYHQKSYSFGSNNVICTSTTATSYNSFQPRNKKLSSRPRTPRKSSSTSNSTSITTEQDSIASAQQPPSVNERYKLFLDEWDKGFMMNYKEQPDGYFADVIYGSIPMDIQGTYVRNGPGNFTIGKESRPIPHPYDGDGLIVSLSIKDGKAFFRSRYVQTHEYVSESNAQQIQFRGTFATQRAGGPLANIMDLYVKNTSNTNVVCFADRLMTFFEAGLPHALDPATLATIGVETLDGCLSLGLPFDLGSTTSNATMGEIMKLAHRIGLYYSSSSSPSHSSPLRIDTPTSSSQLLPDEYVVAGGDAFTAHPHIDPLTGHLHAFKYRMKPSFASSHSSTSSSSSFMNTELVFMEIDHDCKVTASQEFCISGFAFLHDFVLTKDYYIIFQNPVFVDNTPYILGQAPAASCVRWAPDTPTKVHLIPRNAKQQVGSSTKSRGGYRVFDIPPFFVFHHANAYQHGDDQVIIDSIYYDSLPAVGREALTSQQVDPDASFTSRLKRLHLNISTGVVVRCACLCIIFVIYDCIDHQAKNQICAFT